MYGTKIIVRDIPATEPHTGSKRHLEAHRAKAASQDFSLPIAPEVRETAVPNPLLNSVFVQLGITTDAWLVMRTMASGN